MGEYLNLSVILRVVSSEIESMPWVPHRIERVFQEVLCVNRFKQGLVPQMCSLLLLLWLSLLWSL